MARDLVILVSMPWESVYGPSIQLGTLKANLSDNGLPVSTRACNLDFVEWCLDSAEERLSLAEYDAMAQTYSHTGLPEWIFAVPPYSDTKTRDPEFLDDLRLQGVPDALIHAAMRTRSVLPGFLDRCAAILLQDRPRVCAFSLTHCQNVASLVLAKLLKLLDPEVTILFGGANCEGPMGRALHKAFPWIDLVLRGEAERTLPVLLRGLIEDNRVEPVPGLCYRDSEGETVAVPSLNSTVRMEEVPLPDYSDYFGQLKKSGIVNRLLPRLRLPYESSRGCWWGERSHCTFCGISSDSMPYRSKSPGRVVEELTTLAANFHTLNFSLVDYILDLSYFRNVIPELRNAGADFRIFVEVKANLKREQVRQLRDAGVRTIQPGIETLSTPILKLIGKGVTAFQNIRLLKWCEEYGVKPVWNLLTGIPREPLDEYARLADVMLSLTHLEAPTVTELAVYRFSPYFNTPRQLGIEITGPSLFYDILYSVDAELRSELAYFFGHRHLDQREPRTYTGEVHELAGRWRRARDEKKGSLRYRRGPGFLQILDERPLLRRAIYSLNDEESRIYLACEDGASVSELLQHQLPQRSEHSMKTFLDLCVSQRLMYEEEGRYLALALPEDCSRNT